MEVQAYNPPCDHVGGEESGPCPICNPPVQPVLAQVNSLTVYEAPLTQQQLDEMASDAWHIDVNAGGGIVVKVGGTNKILKIETIEGQGTFLRIYSEGKCIFEEKLLDEEATWESFFTSESNDEGETTIMEKDPNNLPLGSSVNLGEIDSLKLKKKNGEVLIVDNPLSLIKINDEIQKINDEIQELRDDVVKWETFAESLYSENRRMDLLTYLANKYDMTWFSTTSIERLAVLSGLIPVSDDLHTISADSYTISDNSYTNRYSEDQLAELN